MLRLLGHDVSTAQLASAVAKGKPASDFLYYYIGDVPALVPIDWRAEPSSILRYVARAGKPLGWTIEAIGDEDEDAWASFTLVRNGVRQSLRARLNGGNTGDDRARFMSDLAAHIGAGVAIVRVALFDGSDSEGFLVLDDAGLAALHAAAGAHFASWFRALDPKGEALVLPAKG